MKLTLAGALLTAALSLAGLHNAAQVCYVVTGLVAWRQFRGTIRGTAWRPIVSQNGVAVADPRERPDGARRPGPCETVRPVTP